MKTLEFIYQESEIHFLVNPHNKNVMVNATEMAKMYGKRIDFFLKSEQTKAFMEAAQFPPYGGNSDNEKPLELIVTKGHQGTFMHRILALKFAAWLSPEFEVWIFSTMDEIIFGNYKKHWDAHAQQEEARTKMEGLKAELLDHGSPELAKEYFQAEQQFKMAKNDKSNAIRNQIKLFNN